MSELDVDFLVGESPTHQGTRFVFSDGAKTIFSLSLSPKKVATLSNIDVCRLKPGAHYYIRTSVADKCLMITVKPIPKYK